MKGLLTALVFFCLVGLAHAQPTTIAVDIHTAKLQWDWVQGAPPDDGIPIEFRVKCGTISGTYTQMTPVPYPGKEIAVNKIVTQAGTYFCAVTSFNEFGESVPSNEVGFRAGSKASAPTGARLVVQ